MLDRIASVITQAGCYLLLIPVCYTGNRWLFVRNTDAYTALTSIITGVLSQIGCYLLILGAQNIVNSCVLYRNLVIICNVIHANEAINARITGVYRYIHVFSG